MGRCIDVPGVTQYNTTQKDHLYHYFEKVRDFADAHPDGPYVYSEWSQIPTTLRIIRGGAAILRSIRR